MNRRTWLATCLVALTIPAVALADQHRRAATDQHRRAATDQQRRASGSGPTVTVRVEGLKKTLLLSTAASGRRGWITKGGTPKGKCPGRSAAGALDAATHGHWVGSYSAQYQTLSVVGILGERHPFTSHDYWSLWVNDKYASSGACGVKLVPGEQLLFAAEPDTTYWYPSQLSAPQSAVAGHTFKAKLVGYGSSGKAKPLGGVRVTGNGINPATTNSNGVATLRAGHTGLLVLRAAPKGRVRTETTVHVAA